MNNFFLKFKRWFNQFSSGQKLYLTSLLVFVLFIFAESGDYSLFYLSGWIALFAMAVDLWPGFIRIWNTFLGRVIILVTYAIVANIAVATAYQKLNEVIGIDPSPLFYSLGFVVLLIAPIFILTITMLVMLVVWMWQQTVFLVNLLLKIVRLKALTLNSQMKHPTTTAFVKLLLIVPMFGAIINGFESYGENIKIADSSFGVSCRDDSGQKVKCDESFTAGFMEGWNQAHKESVESKSGGSETSTSENIAKAEEQTEQDTNTPADSKKKERPGDKINMSTLVAEFVYEIELYARTQCIQAPGERAMFIGEYDIFVAKPNKDSPSGYDFYVRNCVTKSY